MKSITYDKKQMTQYHLHSTMCFEASPHFRPIDIFSQSIPQPSQTVIGRTPSAPQHLPEDTPHPPHQGYAYAHRSLFWQFRLKVNGFAASVFPRLGAGVWVYWGTASLLASARVGEKSSQHIWRWNEKRTLRSLRLRLPLLSGFFLIGAHALSRAPISAQSGEVC